MTKRIIIWCPPEAPMGWESEARALIPRAEIYRESVVWGPSGPRSSVGLAFELLGTRSARSIIIAPTGRLEHPSMPDMNELALDHGHEIFDLDGWREIESAKRRRATGPTPYGYRRSSSGELEPCQVEAPIVRRIHALARSMSARRIAARLAGEGITRRGCRLDRSTILDIIRSDLYLGRRSSPRIVSDIEANLARAALRGRRRSRSVAP